MTKTADTLKAMLTENTGQHYLDSGGAYGRSWQQNAQRDFEAEPAATISVEEGYIDIRRSTFHFLKECLEFDEAMNQRFGEFAKARDPENRLTRLFRMKDFTESINAKGIYGEGDPVTINTYNHDSLLDQVIQYVYFEIDEQGYVLLQIHGGCDVRGGYTAPKAFRCNIEDSQSIFSDGDATITCKGGDHRWYVQEGDWDTDHELDPDANDTRGLDKFRMLSILTEDEETRELDKFQMLSILTEDEEIRELCEKSGMSTFRKLWQDEDGVHCPLCGGILEVW